MTPCHCVPVEPAHVTYSVLTRPLSFLLGLSSGLPPQATTPEFETMVFNLTCDLCPPSRTVNRCSLSTCFCYGSDGSDFLYHSNLTGSDPGTIRLRFLTTLWSFGFSQPRLVHLQLAALRLGLGVNPHSLELVSVYHVIYGCQHLLPQNARNFFTIYAPCTKRYMIISPCYIKITEMPIFRAFRGYGCFCRRRSD